MAASSLDSVTRGLSGLRARIRALFLVTGLSGWVLLAALAVVLFFAADVLLDLPLGVRRFVRLGVLDRHPGLPFLLWLPLTAGLGLLAVLLTRGGRGAAAFVTFLFAGLGGLLVWKAWRALRPLAVRLPDEELVLAVERRASFQNADLKDRLAAALDFAKELPQGGRGESRPMMQAVIHQAEAEARKISLPAVASGRTALAWAGGAAAALLVAVVALGLDAEQTALWARRSLLLEEVAWPRASEVLAVALGEGGEVRPWPAEKPYEVAVGRGLVVHAQVRGKPVDEVLLLDLAEGQQPLPRRMFPVSPQGDVYGVELTNVRQAFRFVLRGGDDQDDLPVYRVEVTVPPAVLDIGAELAFPAYLGRPPERVQGGNLAVPQGTDVVVTFTASVPLASARALVGDATVPATRLAADGGGEAWRFGFKAERSLRYRLLLQTPEGRQNDPTADAFEVAVGEDRPPRVDWIWPRGSVDVTQRGRIPLLLRTLDDHGVSDLTLEVRAGGEGGTLTTIALLERSREAVGPPKVVEADGKRTLEANDGPLGRPQVLTYVPLEVAAHAPSGAGAPRLAVRVLAQDSKGQVREGAWLQVSLNGPAEIERILAKRRAGVKSSVVALHAEAGVALARASDLAAGPLAEPERDLLKTMQYAQGKLERDADAAVRDFLDVFNLFVLDRLGSEHPTERVLAMFDRHHRRTYGTEDASASAATQADDPVFPYALYDEVVRAWREKVLLDNGVLDRMCAVLADAVDVAARLAPAAHAASVRAAAGSRADVEALRAAEQALVDGLDRLRRSLGSWETLADVILQLKRIVEEQKVLHGALDAKPNEPPAPAAPESR